jgi:hypothetical protein
MMLKRSFRTDKYVQHSTHPLAAAAATAAAAAAGILLSHPARCLSISS